MKTNQQLPKISRKRIHTTGWKLAPFAGDGLTPLFKNKSWEAIRNEIYRDHVTGKYS